MTLRVLLATATPWPFPARLAHAFASLGARVEALCLAASPLHVSAVPARLHGFSAHAPLRSLARAIEAAEAGLLIPCDDLMAELAWKLAATRPRFAPLVARSLGAPGEFPVLSARNAFLRAAAEAGAPAADTIALETDGDLDRALAAFGLPLVLKADGSWGGGGVVIAPDAEAARAALARLRHVSRLTLALKALKRREPSLWVRALAAPRHPRPGAQRFVAGTPATSAIACWDGMLLAAHHFDVAVASGGGTGPATVVERVEDAAMQDSAAKIAARFKLSGLYGLDYMRDAEGKVFLLEINPRATPTSHLALGAGHDLVAALMRAAGAPVADRPLLTAKTRIALFPQEMQRDPQSPHLKAGFHDLPLGDRGLLKALTAKPRRLTRFSQGFPQLSWPKSAPGPLSR